MSATGAAKSKSKPQKPGDKSRDKRDRGRYRYSVGAGPGTGAGSGSRMDITVSGVPMHAIAKIPWPVATTGSRSVLGSWQSSHK